MSTAYPYIIKGARGVYNAEINGFEFVVSIVLTGITGDNDIAQLYAALTDSNVPLAGSDLSGVNSALEGCWLRRIETGTIAEGKMDVVLTYQQSQWGITQIDATTNVSQIDTTKYLAGVNKGDNIELEYTYPSDYGGTKPTQAEIDLQNAVKTQGGTVSVLVPEKTRVYTVRLEQTESVVADPTILASAFVGTVNAYTWWQGETGTWLCTSISGTSDNSGEQVTSPTTWVNRYEFQYRSDGWDPEVVYEDDITGKPVPDPVEDESIKVIESYDEADFEELFPGS